MKATSRYEKMGFKQPLQLKWLDYAVMLLLQKDLDCKQKLFDFIKLSATEAGERADGSVKTTIGLLGAWISPDKDLLTFRDQLLKIASELDKTQWLILHWAMIGASYPFFQNVCTVIGRLLSLQDNVTRAQILGRLSEIYGEREIVERQMRYVIQTLMNLNLLKRTETKGIYSFPERIIIENQDFGILLWKSLVLGVENNRLPLVTLRNSLALYAFAMPDISCDKQTLEKAKLELICLGGNSDYLGVHDSFTENSK